MRATILVATALMLAAAGTFAIFVPVAPQIVYTSLTTSHTTRYTALAAYTIRGVSVSDDPHDSRSPEDGDIESVTYEKVEDHLRINVTFSYPPRVALSILIYPERSIMDSHGYWVLGALPITLIPHYSEPIYYYRHGRLSELTAGPDDVGAATVSYKDGKMTIEIPMYIFDHPRPLKQEDKLFVALILGSHAKGDLVPDSVLDGILTEVDLNHVETLTRTLEICETRSSTYISSHSVGVPLAVSLPWLPILFYLASVVTATLTALLVRKR